MPKERRKRTGTHDQSVRLPSQREFAVQDNAVDHVDIGEQSERSAADILADMAADPEPRPTLKKKEKQALKHQLFVERLEQTRSPYSKSHKRRLKRRAREQVAGGMGEIKAAIFALEEDRPETIQNSVTANTDADGTSRTQKARPKPGQIGEGKGVPLSKNQRRRALQVERTRIPMILATPEFAANPFQTIRTHAQNSLLKHEPPTAASMSS